jgi:aspartate/methionine/tyrosine aminotransferase
MNKYDLSWGNSVCVREAFLNTYHGNPLVFAKEELATFDYPNHEGNPELVEATRKVIERQTGLSYKHVFLVNGATGGVVIALRTYAQMGLTMCLTREAPFYVRYPRMIAASGLKHIQHKKYGLEDELEVHLVDLPSNPLGFMTNIYPPEKHDSSVIIDGVYLNNVYAPKLYKFIPRHDVMIGSYSKLLGINGIRIGWLATNDDLLAERSRDLVNSEYCGLSQASTDILKHTLQGFNWDIFETYARFKLDCNREEWSKLERFFENKPTSEVGMFQYSPIDKKCEDLLIKANISWTKGSALGTDDSFGRFNLGAKNEVIEQAVKAMLKADSI